MKQTYITPEMEVINIETEVMIAASPLISNDITGDDARMGRGSHGNWDDIW